MDFLTKYYGIKRMRIVLDGRRVGNGDIACYDNCKAYITMKGLKKRNVLHELYHHIANVEGLDMPIRKEEKEANLYARRILNRFLVTFLSFRQRIPSHQPLLLGEEYDAQVQYTRAVPYRNYNSLFHVAFA